jgi:capsular polysaccharide biosynthesis protein
VELRQYLAVLWRRWPIIALIVVLSALLAAWSYKSAATTYTAAVRLLVRQQPSPENPSFFTFDRYYNWFSNEFLSDDYTLVVSSRAFAEQVAKQLQQNPATRTMTADQVQGAISGDRKQRILTITVNTNDAASAVAIANAAAAALTAQSASGLAPTLNGVQVQDKVEFGLLDPARQAPASNRKALLDAGVRLGLGIVAALALVFLIEYFDDRLRDEAEAERLLGTRVLGAIPRK